MNNFDENLLDSQLLNTFEINEENATELSAATEDNMIWLLATVTGAIEC